MFFFSLTLKALTRLFIRIYLKKKEKYNIQSIIHTHDGTRILYYDIDWVYVLQEH